MGMPEDGDGKSMFEGGDGSTKRRVIQLRGLIYECGKRKGRVEMSGSEKCDSCVFAVGCRASVLGALFLAVASKTKKGTRVSPTVTLFRPWRPPASPSA